MTLVARLEQAPAVEVLVAARALSLNGAGARVARDTRGVDVLSDQREAGRRVIELHGATARADRTPGLRRVARAARCIEHPVRPRGGWRGVRHEASGIRRIRYHGGLDRGRSP